MMEAAPCPTCGRLAAAVLGRCFGCATRAAERRLPERIGPYLILEEIGRGGMGTVYRGRQACPRRDVAVKVIRDALPDPELRRRFLEEREIAGSFEHPNIIRVYDAGEDALGDPYYVMEYAPRGTLADLLVDEVLAPAQAMRLMVEVAFAVHHAHGRGVYHRDLKPANILLDRDLRPRVTDFGVAKTGLEPSEHSAFQAETVVGSWPYMAPEQAGYSAVPSVSCVLSDVYALGAILFELLEGRPPCSARSQAELHAYFRGAVRSPALPRARAVSFELEAVCTRALRLNPRERYESAAAFADDLRCVLGMRKTRAAPTTMLGRMASWSARHAWLLVMLFGALLVSGVALTASEQLVYRESVSRDAGMQEQVRSTAAALERIFRDLGTIAIRASESDALRELLLRGTVHNPATVLEPFRQENELISSVLVLSREGRAIGRWPGNTPEFYEGDFAMREYFRSASSALEQGMGGAYVSPIFRSVADGRTKIAFSTAVKAAVHGQRLGLVAVTVDLDALARFFAGNQLFLFGPEEWRESPDARVHVRATRIGYDEHRRAYLTPAGAMRAEASGALETLHRAAIGESGFAVEADAVPTHLHELRWAIALWLAASTLLAAGGFLYMSNAFRSRVGLALRMDGHELEPNRSRRTT